MALMRQNFNLDVPIGDKTIGALYTVCNVQRRCQRLWISDSDIVSVLKRLKVFVMRLEEHAKVMSRPITKEEK